MSATWLHVYSTDLLFIWHKYNHVASHFQVNSESSKSYGLFEVKVIPIVRSFCCVCSVAPWLCDWFASYVAQIQLISWQCVTHHFQVKRLKFKVTGTFEIFAVPVLWLCAYLTKSLHMWHKYNPWGKDMSCTFPGQRPRSLGVFEMFAVSPLWLFDRIASYVA